MDLHEHLSAFEGNHIHLWVYRAGLHVHGGILCMAGVMLSLSLDKINAGCLPCKALQAQLLP